MGCSVLTLRQAKTIRFSSKFLQEVYDVILIFISLRLEHFFMLIFVNKHPSQTFLLDEGMVCLL